MNWKAVLLALVFALLSCRSMVAQQPSLGLIEADDQDPGKQSKEKKLDKGKPAPDMVPDLKQPDVKPPPPPLPQPQTLDPFDPFGSPGSTSGESTAGFNPHMMGDFATIYARQNVTVTTVTTTSITNTNTTISYMPPGSQTTSSTSTSTSLSNQTRTLLIPIASLGAFNIAENESPRPQDRVFGFYNFFSDLRGPDIGSSPALTTSQSNVGTSSSAGPGPFSATGTTTTTTTTSSTPAVPRPQLNLNREVVGFEKTFLGGYASVEVRLPFLQTQGGGGEFGGSFAGSSALVRLHLELRRFLCAGDSLHCPAHGCAGCHAHVQRPGHQLLALSRLAQSTAELAGADH
jgi:hypothetical protein